MLFSLLRLAINKQNFFTSLPASLAMTKTLYGRGTLKKLRSLRHCEALYMYTHSFGSLRPKQSITILLYKFLFYSLSKKLKLVISETSVSYSRTIQLFISRNGAMTQRQNILFLNFCAVVSLREILNLSYQSHGSFFKNYLFCITICIIKHPNINATSL